MAEADRESGWVGDPDYFIYIYIIYIYRASAPSDCDWKLLYNIRIVGINWDIGGMWDVVFQYQIIFSITQSPSSFQNLSITSTINKPKKKEMRYWRWDLVCVLVCVFFLFRLLVFSILHYKSGSDQMRDSKIMQRIITLFRHLNNEK